MNSEDPKVTLMQAEVARVFLSGVTVMIPKLPFTIKIGIVMLLDRLDCMPYLWPNKGPLFVDDREICKTEYYQKSDKITDKLCYAFLWLYFVFYTDSPKELKIYITIWFFIRLIGTVLYITTGNRRVLIAFPNVFLESLLAIAILQDLGYTYAKHKKMYINILVAVFIYKMAQEYVMHSYIVGKKWY